MRGLWNEKPMKNEAGQAIQCAWCRRVKKESGKWAYSIILGEVSHSICPQCSAKEKRLQFLPCLFL